MKSILLTLLRTTAPDPRRQHRQRPLAAARDSDGSSSGGFAEGWGPGGDFYDAHGPFPTP